MNEGGPDAHSAQAQRYRGALWQEAIITRSGCAVRSLRCVTAEDDLRSGSIENLLDSLITATGSAAGAYRS